LASTSSDTTGPFSVAEPVSATATGPSLVPVMMTVTVELDVAPWLSVMV